MKRFVALSSAVSVLLVTVIVGAATTAAQEADIVICQGLAATIVGTAGDDKIRGTKGDDVIHAGAGKDVVFGRGGNDVICGGQGRDRLKGGPGADQLDGGDGKDLLKGGSGHDMCAGGEGVNTFHDSCEEFDGRGLQISAAGTELYASGADKDDPNSRAFLFLPCSASSEATATVTGPGSPTITEPNVYVSQVWVGSVVLDASGTHTIEATCINENGGRSVFRGRFRHKLS